MSGLTPFVETLHLLLLAGFVLVTVSLFGLSVHNRFRIQNVVAAWRPVSWRAFPMGPILFATAIVGFEVATLIAGRTIPPTLLLGYGIGGLAWFLAAWVSSVTIVSACGIVADIHRRDLCVAWGQVTDYFEFEKGRKRGFVFFYKEENGETRRLEMEVPRKLMPLLREHIDWRLSPRFEASSEVFAPGSRAMNQ
jgi:hypothetical protein